MEFNIKNKRIGENNPCFIIAELGINHQNNINIAKKMIDSAYDAKCDSIKLQMFKADKLYTQEAGEINFNKLKYSVYDHLKQYELPLEWVSELKEYCNNKGLILLSSVCDEESADLIEKYLEAYKLTSFAITHTPLQIHIAKKNKPIIFSTGGAILEEVKEAYNNISKLNKKIAILHCVIKYPCPLEYCNLNVLDTLKKEFPHTVIGYSDHTEDPILAPVAAVAKGAKIIEKHITLNKNMKGPDHSFALEPQELKSMVSAIREAEKKLNNGDKVHIDPVLLGSPKKKTYDIEKYLRNFSYRTIFTTKEIRKGELITKDNIAVLRRGNNKIGIHPKYYIEILTKEYMAKKDIKKGKSLTWGDISTVPITKE